MSQDDTRYIYVLVRKDLSLSQQAVQSCHAAIESARKFVKPDQEHPHLILCGVNNESALKREASKLQALGVRFAKFHEADCNNELTAVATELISGDRRRYFRRYKLLKQNAETRAPP